jgi:PAS domain S-box-containing protein
LEYPECISINLTNIISKLLPQYSLLLLNESLVGNNELITCLDLQGNFKYVNPKYSIEVGYNSDELINMSVFDILHPSDDSNFRELCKKTAENKQPAEAMLRVSHKNGHWIMMNTICTPFVLEEKTVALVNYSSTVTLRCS